MPAWHTRRLWNDKFKHFFFILITETLRIIKRQFCFVILLREKYTVVQQWTEFFYLSKALRSTFKFCSPPHFPTYFLYTFSQHLVPKSLSKTFFVRLMLPWRFLFFHRGKKRVNKIMTGMFHSKYLLRDCEFCIVSCLSATFFFAYCIFILSFDRFSLFE